jgi:hypothetical protein
MAITIAPQQNGLDFPLMAGAGRIAGQSSVTAFGYSSNTASVTNVNLWQPQVAWALATTPVGIEYVSTSASDGVAGTGARKILVIGVGPAFALQIETVTMNGTTVVASAYTWMAINTMVVFDNATTGFGSALGNVGDISAKVTGAGALHGFITAGFGVSQHGRYTVPAGFTWLINNFFFLGNKAGGAVASFSLSAITVTSTGLLVHGLPLTMQNGAVLQIGLPNTPVPLTEKNTLMFRIASVSTAGMDISGGCTGVLTAN